MMLSYERVLSPLQTFAPFFVVRYLKERHDFREVVTGFLGNRRADNYKDLMEELLSSYQKLG